MSEAARNDSLQSLPVDEWKILRDTLKTDWPLFAHYYYLIDNAIAWKDKDPSWQCDYLCPDGDPRSGVFLAVTQLPTYNVIPFAFHGSEDKLFDCLTNTQLIDWSENILVRSIQDHLRDTVERAVDYVAKIKGLQIYARGHLYNYIKSKEDCAEIDTRVPDDIEIKLFREKSHVQQIFDVWPHEEFKENCQKSKDYLSYIVRLNGGIGLFTKSDGKLVTWALKNDWAGIGMVQTLNEYKRRGYAKIAVNALAKVLSGEGLDSTAMIFTDNAASHSLFTSLGWRVTSSINYLKLKPL